GGDDAGEEAAVHKGRQRAAVGHDDDGVAPVLQPRPGGGHGGGHQRPVVAGGVVPPGVIAAGHAGDRGGRVVQDPLGHLVDADDVDHGVHGGDVGDAAVDVVVPGGDEELGHADRQRP